MVCCFRRVPAHSGGPQGLCLFRSVPQCSAVFHRESVCSEQLALGTAGSPPLRQALVEFLKSDGSCLCPLSVLPHQCHDVFERILDYMYGQEIKLDPRAAGQPRQADFGVSLSDSSDGEMRFDTAAGAQSTTLQTTRLVSRYHIPTPYVVLRPARKILCLAGWLFGERQYQRKYQP